jgi:cytochrome c
MDSSLEKLFNQIAGSKEGFRYSGPMKRSGLIWNEANLRDFLTNPQDKIPGNRMPFSGVENKNDLDLLVEYLKAKSK